MVPFNGVGLTNHPRGGRLGNFNWHFPGKQTAAFLDGTVNDDSDRDRGWTVELAFPWRGMAELARADHRALPPGDGDVWRLDFSRFNAYKEAQPAKDSGGWFWTRHGVWDSHIPECFAYVTFSTNDVSRVKFHDASAGPGISAAPLPELARQLLHGSTHPVGASIKQKGLDDGVTL